MLKTARIAAASFLSLVLVPLVGCSDVADVESTVDSRELDLAELEELEEGTIEVYPGVLRKAQPGGAEWAVTGSEAHLWLRARLIEHAELDDEPERAAQRDAIIAGLTVAALNMVDAPREDDVTFRRKTLSACVYAVGSNTGYLAKASGERTGIDYGDVCVDTMVHLNTTISDPPLESEWDKASQQTSAYSQETLNGCSGFASASAGNQTYIAEVFTCPASNCVGNCCPTTPPPPPYGGVGDGGGGGELDVPQML